MSSINTVHIPPIQIFFSFQSLATLVPERFPCDRVFVPDVPLRVFE